MSRIQQKKSGGARVKDVRGLSGMRRAIRESDIWKGMEPVGLVPHTRPKPKKNKSGESHD